MLRDIEAEKALFEKLGMFKDPELLEKYVIASEVTVDALFFCRVFGSEHAAHWHCHGRPEPALGRPLRRTPARQFRQTPVNVIYKSLAPALLALLHGLHARHILLQVAVRICVLITCDSNESARFASFSLSASSLPHRVSPAAAQAPPDPNSAISLFFFSKILRYYFWSST